jgi:hypothetical protein
MSDTNEQPQKNLHWHKPAQGPESGIEVAFNGDSIFVRKSNESDGAVLTFTKAEWRAFLIGADRTEFSISALKADGENPTI